MKLEQGAFTALACIGVLVGACHIILPEALVSPVPVAIVDQGDCGRACDNLAQLGCSAGKPIDMGTTCNVAADCLGPDGTHEAMQACVNGRCTVSCVDFCHAEEDGGVWLDPTCVAQVTTCEQVSFCPTPTGSGTSCSGSGCQVAPGTK